MRFTGTGNGRGATSVGAGHARSRDRLCVTLCLLPPMLRHVLRAVPACLCLHALVILLGGEIVSVAFIAVGAAAHILFDLYPAVR